MTAVIAFTGPAGCGKSTASDLLIASGMGFRRVKFAGGLKSMLRGLYVHLGLPMAEIEAKIEGDLKEKPCALLGGKTPRYAMQTLGSEWGRDLLDSDLWVKVWEGAAISELKQGGAVVTDDCRFENEAAVIRGIGGLIVGIRRPGLALDVGDHASEAGVEPDLWVTNDGDIEYLRQKVISIAFNHMEPKT